MAGRLILVGRVAGAFGVLGEVRITAYTEEPMSLARFGDLKREDGSPGLTIQSARPAKGGIICRAAEVATKEAADALRGLKLHVPRDALPPTGDEDDFYVADLVGLRAETAHGERLGLVKSVQNFGAGDILELDPGSGAATLYMPFTREVVPEVSLAEGRLVVAPPAETEDDDR